MCKMAHFGNCDPETADQEYCIFHKPDKSEEEAVEFYRKFLERFKPRVEEIEVDGTTIKRLVFERPVDARGFVFPEIPRSVGFSFEYTTFKEDVNFSHGIFESGVSFMESIFIGNAKFDHVTFKRNTYFPFVKFLGGVSFFASVFLDDVHFDRTIFSKGSEKYLNFMWVRFKGDAYFHNCSFRGNVDSRDTIFHKTAYFSRSTFDGWVKLYGATFKGETDFSECSFLRDFVVTDANFFETVSFAGSKFGESSNLESWVNLSNVVFSKGVRFDECTFNLPFHLHQVEFKEEVSFETSEFNREIVFSNVVFSDYVSFSEAIFRAPSIFGQLSIGMIPVLEYSGIAIEEDPDSPVIFKGPTNFSASVFEGYSYFEGTVFKEDVSFEGASFNEPISFQGKPENEKFKFHGKLDFFHVDIRKGIDIDIPSEWFKLPEAEIEARRVQRLTYEKEGKREEADRMFVLEMRAKRRARLKNAQGKLSKVKAYVHNFVEWLLADLPSEYGTNWVRLFLFSLLVIIGNAVPYTIWSKLIEGFPETSSYFIRFANALYYSLVTFTTLGYGDMHPTGWLKALSAIEALTGAVFMALIVAVIARKWMR
ncbi:potassium channel family protein [Thermococcus sp. 5-4]|uniref:potassium channel family protein n=1 Tax=Thermococcus sp. 5-4 TaxID=2008440 RepID=UPI000B497F20|nr:potassium channel family protein [Thermococcus sp. 5-4]ASA78262.1 hypothetical protein CDI07_08135 [Thermococcus sp. 5-4]